MLAPHSHQRYRFVPRPAGTRWYHSHIYAGRNLHRSTYTGQFGFLIIEGKNDPGRYDQEILLTLHGWEPFLSSMNALGSGEPVKVKEGQRVLFRVLNASASSTASLFLVTNLQ